MSVELKGVYRLLQGLTGDVDLSGQVCAVSEEVGMSCSCIL